MNSIPSQPHFAEAFLPQNTAKDQTVSRPIALRQMMVSEPKAHSHERQKLKGLWDKRKVVSLVGVLLFGGWFLGELTRELAMPEFGAMNEPAFHGMIAVAFVAFIVLAALPFVPGAEIGFALLLVSGGQLAPLVYFGMVGALTVTYIIARVVPSAVLGQTLDWLGLKKVSAFIADLDALRPEERMRALSFVAPTKVGQNLLRHRYVLMAVALNIPGNSLIGGGGGLAFIAGASRLFPFWHFLAIVSCAVAPVPLFFLLM